MLGRENKKNADIQFLGGTSRKYENYEGITYFGGTKYLKKSGVRKWVVGEAAFRGSWFPQGHYA